ncbi:hypothetical protein SMACR_09354 [Sordaria macrospora]|uniref:WGS project CABT00000000 data, contig 2.87 n=2 Tax=Sordaria macrospora TaxID=5147 RepID=F7WBW8_SORMK|nr:uncharacterized protein SMAC_09354 [Sordaria macrospora k-hell]KAA8624288.1 hypothetical protein SMACR_09354 [Sordaria macrospora]WPJ66148.1 hypothetical protein SMAC4_09354 [Sordaria macrospora]CCC14497.1 unnamed protein product [Sordaria macrospora k-hell]
MAPLSPTQPDKLLHITALTLSRSGSRPSKILSLVDAQQGYRNFSTNKRAHEDDEKPMMRSSDSFKDFKMALSCLI